jgi:hypothetical protein
VTEVMVQAVKQALNIVLVGLTKTQDKQVTELANTVMQMGTLAESTQKSRGVAVQKSNEASGKDISQGSTGSRSIKRHTWGRNRKVKLITRRGRNAKMTKRKLFCAKPRRWLSCNGKAAASA